MKKITVVLSGVGISGYSGIALMEFFDKHQIKPNIIVGCSTGALIAALWAKGFGPEEALEKITQVFEVSQKPKIDFLTSLFFFKSLRGKHAKDKALLKASHIQKIYHDIFENQRIEHLPVQTMFQTTNVDKGEMVMIKEGLIADAVYASSAILPFYPAIKLNNMWLADGVFSGSLPLKFILDEKSEIIIAMDINTPKEKKSKSFLTSYSEFLQKALKISNSPHTAMVYDLHNDEILIIPIKIIHTDGNDSLDALHHVIGSARASIANKAKIILDTVKNA